MKVGGGLYRAGGAVVLAYDVQAGLSWAQSRSELGLYTIQANAAPVGTKVAKQTGWGFTINVKLLNGLGIHAFSWLSQ